MKKNILATILYFLGTSSLLAQTEFTKSYHSPNNGGLKTKKVEINLNNELICIAESGNPENDVFFSIDSIGQITQSKIYSVYNPSNSYVQFLDILSLPDSTVLISGVCTESSTNERRSVFILFDKNLDTLWSLLSNPIPYNSTTFLYHTWTTANYSNDSTIILASSFNNQTLNLMKVDLDGQIIWNNSLAFTDKVLALSILVDSSNQIFVSGGKSPGNNAHGWLSCFSPGGLEIWTKQYDSAPFEDSKWMNGKILIRSSLNDIIAINTDGNINMAIETNLWDATFAQKKRNLCVLNDTTIGFITNGEMWNTSSVFLNENLQISEMYSNQGNGLELLISSKDEIIHAVNGPLIGIKQKGDINPQLGISKFQDLNSAFCLNNMFYNSSTTFQITPSLYSIATTTSTSYGAIELIIDVPSIYVAQGCVDIFGGLEENNNLPLKVYPVPSQSTVTFQFESNDKRIINILNVSGDKIVSQHTFDIKTTLNLENFSPGLYIYEILEAEKSVRGKIIVD